MLTVTLLIAAVILLAIAVALLAYALAVGRRRARAAGAPAGDGELRRLLGLLAHELRTPLGAIIGYEELLTAGLLGPIPERAQDALRRIGISGAQLRHLIDGLSDLVAGGREVSLDLEAVDAAAAASTAAASAQALASGRGIQLDVRLPPGLPELVTDGARLAAALDLALGAAVRASPGGALTLTFAADDGALLARVDGTALDPVRDGLAPAPRELVARPAHVYRRRAVAAETGEATGTGRAITSGAALRLAMAARIAAMLGGELTLEGQGPTTLRLRIPPAPMDALAGGSG